MGIKIKNLQTGEFEKFNIPALKGEKGEPGEIEPSEKVDYIGKQHSKLRDTMNANVDYIIKTAIGEFNYLDYEGQHITATNSIEGHVKSAILKGQTLVNLATENSIQFTTAGDWKHLKTNQKMLNTTKNYMVKFNSSHDCNGYVHLRDKATNTYITDSRRNNFKKGSNVFLLGRFLESDLESFSNICITFFLNNGSATNLTITDVMLIEYQEGMENWDIPYFEGMASCKMPVLTTTGKNLFNESLLNGNQRIDDEGKYVSKTTPEPTKTGDFVIDKGFQEKTTYTFMTTVESSSWVNLQIVYTDGTRYTLGGWANNTCYKTSDGSKTIDFITFTSGGSFKVYDIYLEKGGNTAPTYEPYKSNILTTPEDLELRGIGDVKDELNVATGELTQRFTKIVVDGVNYKIINDAVNNDKTRRFGLNFSFEKFVGEGKWITLERMNASVISDKAVCVYDGSRAHPNRTAIASYNGIPILFIEDKTVLSIAQANQWLQQNPITIQYELATPTIKTVDLSDNHVYSYKGTTHYDCSSAEGSLVPTLSVKVPTDTQLTIQEQKAATQTLLIKNMDLQQSIKEVQAMNLAFNTALYNSFNSIREEVEDIKKHVSTNENLEGSF